MFNLHTCAEINNPAPHSCSCYTVYEIIYFFKRSVYVMHEVLFRRGALNFHLAQKREEKNCNNKYNVFLLKFLSINFHLVTGFQYFIRLNPNELQLRIKRCSFSEYVYKFIVIIEIFVEIRWFKKHANSEIMLKTFSSISLKT